MDLMPGGVEQSFKANLKSKKLSTFGGSHLASIFNDNLNS